MKYLKANIFSSNSAYRALVYLAVGTVIGGGVVFGYGSSRSSGHANDSQIAANFTAVELVEGCIASNTASGSCLQVTSGVTNDSWIFTKSGGLLVGPFNAPKFSVDTAGNLSASGAVALASTLRSDATGSLGWSVVAGANTACNTTCTSACVIGIDTLGTGGFLDCATATADFCLCAGAN